MSVQFEENEYLTPRSITRPPSTSPVVSTMVEKGWAKNEKQAAIIITAGFFFLLIMLGVILYKISGGAGKIDTRKGYRPAITLINTSVHTLT